MKIQCNYKRCAFLGIFFFLVLCLPTQAGMRL